MFILVIVNEDLTKNHVNYLMSDVLLSCNVDASFNCDRITHIDKRFIGLIIIESFANIVLMFEISNKNRDYRLFFVDKNANEPHEKINNILNENRTNKSSFIDRELSIAANFNDLFGINLSNKINYFSSN